MRSASVPTEYAGRVFRSRLEARWAAFFDLAGVAWEYEPESPFGGWWPDFRVEAISLDGEPYGAFAEVKPVAFSPIGVDRAYAKALHPRWTLLLPLKPDGDFIGFLAVHRDGAIKTIGVRLTDRGLEGAPLARRDYGSHAERVWERAGDRLPNVGLSLAVSRAVEAYTGKRMFEWEVKS